MAVTILIAALGIFVSYYAYIRNTDFSARTAERFSGIHQLLKQKFYVDELYETALIRPVRRISRTFLWRFVDVRIIDGAVNGTASMVQGWSSVVRLLQSGYVRSYAAWILCGSFLVLLYYLW